MKNKQPGMESLEKGLKCDKCGGKFAARVNSMCIDCNDDNEKMKQIIEEKGQEYLNDVKNEPSVIAYRERHGK